MSAGFCQEVDAIAERMAWLNEVLRDRPAADVAAEISEMAAKFGALVNRSLADLSPDVAARALRMAADLAELAREEAVSSVKPQA